MRKFLFFLFTSIIIQTAQAQITPFANTDDLEVIDTGNISSEDRHSRRDPSDFYNSIYIGYFGDNTFFGINYERFFMLNQRLMLAGKIGFAYNERWSARRDRLAGKRKGLVTIPHYLTVNFRTKKNFLETGLGGLLVDNRYVPMFIAGYRVHPLKAGRFNFRINLAYPLTDELSVFYFPIGLSSGIVF